jgi:hypothetical protein
MQAQSGYAAENDQDRVERTSASRLRISAKSFPMWVKNRSTKSPLQASNLQDRHRMRALRKVRALVPVTMWA